MGQILWGVILIILFHILGFLIVIEASIDLMKEMMQQEKETTTTTSEKGISLVKPTEKDEKLHQLTIKEWLKPIVECFVMLPK